MARRAGLALVLLLALAPVTAASAADTATYDSAEQCMQSLAARGLTGSSCQSVDGRTWTASSSEHRLDGSGFGSGIFTTLLVLVVLWSLVPLGIAMWLANQRGESAGVAVLLTLVLGWIGLAIVYFGQVRSRQAVETLAGGGPPPLG